MNCICPLYSKHPVTHLHSGRVANLKSGLEGNRTANKSKQLGKEIGSPDPLSRQFLQRLGGAGELPERERSLSRCWENFGEQGSLGLAGQNRLRYHMVIHKIC